MYALTILAPNAMMAERASRHLDVVKDSGKDSTALLGGRRDYGAGERTVC
jgi:hypothetical protein